MKKSYNLEKTENIDNNILVGGDSMSEHEVMSVVRKINIAIWSILLVNVLVG